MALFEASMLGTGFQVAVPLRLYRNVSVVPIMIRHCGLETVEHSWSLCAHCGCCESDWQWRCRTPHFGSCLRNVSTSHESRWRRSAAYRW